MYSCCNDQLYSSHLENKLYIYYGKIYSESITANTAKKCNAVNATQWRRSETGHLTGQ